MGAMFVFLACIVGVGCRRNPPPVAKPAPPAAAPQPYSSYFFSNALAYLRPLPSENPVDADHAKKVWFDLLPGMVKDAKSRELVQRLHGDLPVEFDVIDAKLAKDDIMKSPPPKGIPVAYRVADVIVEESKQKGGPKPLFARAMKFGQVIFIPDAATKSLPNLASAPEAMTSAFKELPPHEPVFLLMEDYVLRQIPGWIMVQDPFDAKPKLPATIEEQRKDLDRRIEAYATRAKTYFDAIRKRP